jgi:hypothetical protein
MKPTALVKRIAFSTAPLIAVWLIGCDGPGCPKDTVQDGNVCRHVAPQSSASDAGDTAKSGEKSDAVSLGSTSAGSSATGNGSPAKGSAGQTAGSGTMSASAAAGSAAAASAGTGGTSNAAGSGGSAGKNAGTGASGADANSGSGPCQGKAGATVCDKAVMHHCSAAGTSDSQKVCMNDMYCQVGLESGECAVCNPGTFECTGTRLDECTAAGQYMMKDTCPSAALCKKAAGACTDMVCNPNAKTCAADGTLQTCNADGSAFVSPESCGANLCDATRGRCNKCVPGATRCDGTATAMKCNSDGQSEAPTPCTAAAGGCATSSCSAGECRAGLKPAGTTCLGTNMCTRDGQCVECLAATDCDSSSQMCVGGACLAKPCGNGLAEVGENCDPGATFFNRIPAQLGTICDPNSCRLTDKIYAQCTEPGRFYWDGSPWFCSSTGVYTVDCAPNGIPNDDTCRTNGLGLAGKCLAFGSGGKYFCAVPCDPSNNGCSLLGLKCVTITDGTGPTHCGTKNFP